MHITEESKLTKNQKIVKDWKVFSENGHKYQIRAEIRWDDECSNGHNSFSITGETQIAFASGWNKDRGGCIHEEVAKHFPELAPFIKWHLSSSDGPMHYIANTVFHAGNRDHWGHAPGDVSKYEYGVRFNGVPITHRLKNSFYSFLKQRYGTGEFQVQAIAHEKRTGDYESSPKYTFVGFGEKWYECPFNDKTAADQMAAAFNTCAVEFIREATEWSEGKPRDLDAARHCAVWPEATDDELMAPGLEGALLGRLPALLAAFRKDVESLGLVW